jgi:DNA-binding MurR/RpiR family transcriptional regulator
LDATEQQVKFGDGRMTVAERIAARMNDMPDAMIRAARYCTQHPDRVVDQSIAELSDAASVGQASIVRLCKLLGYAGFRDFKRELVADMARDRGFMAARNALTADVDIDRLNAALQVSIQATCEHLVKAEVDAVAAGISASGRVIAFGSGASALCASLFAFRMIALGLPVFAIDNSRMAQLAAAALSKGGFAVAISFSGVTLETLDFLRKAKASGAQTLAITARESSEIARTADHVLPFHLSDQQSGEGSLRFVAPFLTVAEVLADSLIRQRGN